MLEYAGIGWKVLEKAGICWNRLEEAVIDGIQKNSWIRLKYTGMDCNRL